MIGVKNEQAIKQPFRVAIAYPSTSVRAPAFNHLPTCPNTVFADLCRRTAWSTRFSRWSSPRVCRVFGRRWTRGGNDGGRRIWNSIFESARRTREKLGDDPGVSIPYVRDAGVGDGSFSVLIVPESVRHECRAVRFNGHGFLEDHAVRSFGNSFYARRARTVAEHTFYERNYEDVRAQAENHERLGSGTRDLSGFSRCPRFFFVLRRSGI